jgi:excisionase family DNA binding protein
MLLRAKQVAVILNCSMQQVYALKDRGELPFVRIGGMVRFRPEDVEDLIVSSTVEKKTGPRKAPSSSVGRPFKHLDAGRLLDSWRRQGVRIDPQDARTAPTSG